MTKQTEKALKMAIEDLTEFLGEIAPASLTIQACKKALEQSAQREYVVNSGGTGTELRKPAQEPVALKFPTMLRKMWSGTEVQEWLDKNTHPAPSWQTNKEFVLLSDDEIQSIT